MVFVDVGGEEVKTDSGRECDCISSSGPISMRLRRLVVQRGGRSVLK